MEKLTDTVDHQILLSKLANFKIRGIPLNCLKGHLTKRYQFVKISNKQSEALFIEYGVHQRSVSGPSLFLIYLNDLHTMLPNTLTRTTLQMIQICSTEANLSKIITIR